MALADGLHGNGYRRSKEVLALDGNVHCPSSVETETLNEPYRSELLGLADEAAEQWAERDMPYDQALALARGDARARGKALEIAEGLGARPLAARLSSL